jgi:L-ascorbate metabolism protein UlaG (beta-lactamase superfamily)
MADLTFIGTATVLLRFGPFTLLTDPNFLHRGERAYLGYGLTSKRLTDPAMQPSDLPPLDAVVLSHLHGDHWDRRARAELDKSLPIITTTHAARRLSGRAGFRCAVGLDTWEDYELTKEGWTLRIVSAPAVHSTRRLVKALLPPVMGSLLELAGPDGRHAGRWYLSGDTMPFEGLAQVAERGPIDTAVIHVGGTTLPGGFIVTMRGLEAVEALRTLRPTVAVPVHYGDYSVFKEPFETTRRVIDGAGLDVQMHYVARGETLSL